MGIFIFGCGRAIRSKVYCCPPTQATPKSEPSAATSYEVRGQEWQCLANSCNLGGGPIARLVRRCHRCGGDMHRKWNSRLDLLSIGLMALVVSVPIKSDAACVCRCVNGEMQAICSSSIDVPPICPPTVCAITPPSIAPLPSVTLPPLGTSNCVQRQVLNPSTGRYEWRELCR